MKALSIRQPWAWLICAGLKDIENRNWRIGREGTVWASPRSCNLTMPTRIYVHASKKVDDDGAIWLWEHKKRLGIQDCMLDWTNICNTWKQGAIIGEVDIVDCVTESDSPWFVGPYGFVLRNPVAYDKPIPYKGRLGFFEVTLLVEALHD